jgi:dihydrodipicolinate synthase/N-acetylneuraminate lyase
MEAKKFTGVVVPMVTPLNPDFSIDEAAVVRIMKSFSDNFIHPLVLGTTGESCSIGAQESLRMVKVAVAAKGPEQLVYAGLVGNQMEELIERGNQYLTLGADAVVATLPSYYTLTPEQMYTYYIQLADHLQGPLLLYNIKATTQMSIPLEIVDKLSAHPNIFGLKDSERDAERMKESIERYRKRNDFSYFCGWGAQSAGSLSLGADGIVPSTGNIVPEWYKKLYLAAREGDFETAIALQALTDEVATLYQKDRTLGQSLSALKAMMHSVGLCNTTMMPPLTELSESEIEAILKQFPK